MRLCSAALIVFSALTLSALAQGPRPALSTEETKALIEKREAIEKQLEDIPIIDRKVMVPMSDGARMAADIYRPKDTSKKYPLSSTALPTTSTPGT
jgi:uncharacterized protein